MKSTLAITSIIFTLGILSLPIVWSDNDFEWGEREWGEEIEHYRQKSSAVAATENPLYQEECGSCHMAYPAGLLPARSWQKIMAGLEDHFGDNGELDQQTAEEIQQYLLANSADRTDYRRSRKFLRAIGENETPMRITELRYFKHEHDEIPRRMVSGNPKVKSFSQCNACHSRAEQGSFNEHEVHIPGYGRWDD